MSHFALKVQNMSCGYGSKFHLANVDFTIDQGSFTSIIGPNGAGKTTLFRAISGMLSIENGDIFLEGENLKTLSHKARARKIAIVNQSVEAGAMRIEDYVLMGRLPYRTPFSFFETKEDYEIAEENMRLTGVWEKRHKLMDQLSGGEQQLAAIARALTQKTNLLLLDEPTAHLDISHQMKVLNLVRRLNHETKLTVLLIIHDLNLASEYSDQLIMLKEGTIFAQGTPEEVLTYNNIEEVYNTVVITRSNPMSGKPFIFPVSEVTLREDISKKTIQSAI